MKFLINGCFLIFKLNKKQISMLSNRKTMGFRSKSIVLRNCPQLFFDNEFRTFIIYSSILHSVHHLFLSVALPNLYRIMKSLFKFVDAVN